MTVTTDSTTTAVSDLDATVDAAALKAALLRVKPAIAKANGGRLPVLQTVRIDGHGDHVTVTATDLDLTLEVNVPSGPSSVGSALVPVKTLTKLVGKTKGTIGLLADPEVTDKVVLTAGKARIDVRTWDLPEFPVLPDIGWLSQVSLDLDAMREVTGAVSTDDARPILNTVLVHDQDMVGTDSYRLFLVRSQNTLSADPILVMRNAAAYLGKLGGVTNGVVGEARTKAPGHTNGYLRVFRDDLVVTTRLMDGDFPNYKQLVPSTDERLVSFGPEFLPALEWVADMWKSVSDRWGSAAPVRLEAPPSTVELGDAAAATSSAHMTLAIRQADAGDVTVPVPVTWHTGLTLLAYNPEYLISSLKGLPFDGIIGLDALKPAMAKLVDDEGREHVRLLMPVRVS